MTILKEETINRIKSQLLVNPKGMIISDLSHILKINRNNIAKYLEILLISGDVEMKMYGNAKVYSLTHRVPLIKMLDSSSDYIIILDGSGSIVWINNAIRSILKENPDTYIGKPLKDTEDTFLQQLPSNVTLEPEEIITETAVSVHEELQYFRITQTPIVLTNGKDGSLLWCENITKEKTFEGLIELLEAHYQAIVEDLAEFIVRFLPDGRLTFVNGSYASFMGRAAGELVGTPFLLDISEEDIAIITNNIALLSPAQPVTNHTCKTWSNNDIRYYRWTFRAIFDNQDHRYEYQGIGRDITEQVEAEKGLKRHAADMEFISRKALEFLELPHEGDLYAAIAEGLSELLPHVFILVSSGDILSDEFTLRYVHDKRVHETFREITGKDLIGFHTHGDDPDEFGVMKQNNLCKVYGDIHGSLFRQVPYTECRAIEERLNIGSVYVLDLPSNGKILGSIALLAQKGDSVSIHSTIKAYIHLSSLSLAWKKADESLQYQVQGMDFLLKKGREFLSLPHEDEVYEAIGRAFTELLPDTYISISSFDPSTSVSTVRYAAGKRVHETFREITGRELIGLRYTIDDPKIYTLTGQGSIIPVPGGLYTGLFGQVSYLLCKKIEEELNMNEMYIGCFSFDDHIFGNVALLPPDGAPIPDLKYIETFVNYTSLILGWRKVSSALFLSEEKIQAIEEEKSEFIVRFLPDGHFTSMNSAYAHFLTEGQNDLPRKVPIPEIISSVIPVLQKKVQMKDSTPSISIKCRIKDNFGQMRWQQWSIHAILDQTAEIAEFQGVGRDITRIHDVEEKNCRLQADHEFISRKIDEFQRLLSDQDMYYAIIQGLREIVPDSTITISSYDSDTNSIIAKGIIPGEVIHLFKNLTGEDIIGKRLRFNDPYAMKTTQSGKLIKIPSDLYFTMSGDILLEVSREIETTFSMGRDKYFIGLVFQDRILGVVMIVPKEGDCLPNHELIETYIRQVSIALSQRLTREKMQENEEMLLLCSEAKADVVFRILPDGTMLSMNQAFCDAVKIEKPNLVGRSLLFMIPENEQHFVHEGLKNITSQDPHVMIKHRLICADGELLHIECNYHGISHKNDNIETFFCLGKILPII